MTALTATAGRSMQEHHAIGIDPQAKLLLSPGQ